MPRLDLRHLDMLVAIERCRTLADAAEQLHISASALTHRLREAERRLGVLLFHKVGRSLRPTAAAQILTQTAARVRSDLAEAERVAIASSESAQQVVRLSVAVYSAFHWLPDFLAWFREEHPGIQIQMETRGVADPFDNLAKWQVDLVISPDSVMPGGLEAVPLFADELVAVVSPGHPYAGRAFLRGEDFREVTYLTYSLVKQPGYEADRVWSSEQVMPVREEDIGSIEAVCELVKAGFGISILSHWGLQPHFASGSLRPVRVTEAGLDLTWRAIFRANAAADAPERLLAEALSAWFLGHPPPRPHE